MGVALLRLLQAWCQLCCCPDHVGGTLLHPCTILPGPAVRPFFLSHHQQCAQAAYRTLPAHAACSAAAARAAGVYTLHDLRQFGRKQGWCPYFLARHMMAFSNVVVYSYQYMIDPKVSQMVSRWGARQQGCMQGAARLAGSLHLAWLLTWRRSYMIGCSCQSMLLVMQCPGLAGATSPRPALPWPPPCLAPSPPPPPPPPAPTCPHTHHCRELEKESIVVFDEAHNIDNVCIEALSVSMRKQTLEAAGANINKLSDVRGQGTS